MNEDTTLQDAAKLVAEVKAEAGAVKVVEGDQPKESKMSAAKKMKPEVKPKAKKVTKLKVVKPKVESKPKNEKKAEKSKVHQLSICSTCKKAKTRTPRTKWCHACYKIRRTRQLKANNVVWRKRVEKGRASHHLSYRGKPTVFAIAHKGEALKLLKKYKTETRIEENKKVLAKIRASS